MGGKLKTECEDT